MKKSLFFVALVFSLSSHAACPILEGEYINCISTGPGAQNSEPSSVKVTQSQSPTDIYAFESMNPSTSKYSRVEYIADGVSRRRTETTDGGSTYEVNVLAKCDNGVLVVDISLPNSKFGAEKISFTGDIDGLVKTNEVFRKVLNTTTCEKAH
ncbi:hypothetical protein D3C87_89810 [compost metagenome]